MLLAGPSALADKLGIIGDSLSTAMSADDQCDDINDCLLQTRSDREFSSAGGLPAALTA